MPWELPVGPAALVRTDVLALDEAALTDWVSSLGEKPFRGRQLFAWLHQRRARSFDEMTDLSKDFRARMLELAELRIPVVDEVKVAADGTRKYRLTTHDGHSIEAVWIPHASGPQKHALCISSQVGCAMGCAFCATAALKLTRHLGAGEIVGQVYAVLRDLEDNLPEDPPLPAGKVRYEPELEPDAEPHAEAGAEPRAVDDDRPGKPRRRIQNIVYMGMGEPLHNIDNVIVSIRLLTSERGLCMSPRRITVSTSGLVSALERLGQESDVHLAVSLNATTDDVRQAIMPVTKRWGIAALLDACRAFPLERRRRITFEYVMLQNVNDSDDDARRLVALMAGMRCKVNLIPFNAHPLSPYARPADERVEAFRRILDDKHVSCFVRTTRGLDIDAACGMLGAQKLEKARRELPVVPS